MTLLRVLNFNCSSDEISDILNRHATLVEANRDLMEHSTELEREVDNFRRNLQQLKTEKQNHLLVSTSIIQDQQDELEKMKSSVKNQEEEKLQIEGKKKDTSKELSQITAAIRNLFGRCFNTMRIKPVFAGQKETATLSELLDYELDIILLRISDLVEICNDFKYSQEQPVQMLNSSTGELKDTSTNSLPSGSKSVT